MTNQHGRKWEELDALRAWVHIPGAFALFSADGVPLCGRHIPNEKTVAYTAPNWKQDHGR